MARLWRARPEAGKLVERGRRGLGARAFLIQPGPIMTNTTLDVLCIGNAIVDVIADADDAFLAASSRSTRARCG